MKKRISIAAIALILCLVFAQSAFAVEYSDAAKPLDTTRDTYSLKEAFWFNPTLFTVDVVQFLQAYLAPDAALEFYMDAAQFTDDEIEEYFPIYLSMIEPELAGYYNYYYMCDLEEFAEAVGYVFDPTMDYTLDEIFTTREQLNEIFPEGISRTAPYDTFRRTAIHLARYVAKYGKTPAFDEMFEYIDYVFAMYMQQYEEAMAAEAAAQSQQVEVTN